MDEKKEKLFVIKIETLNDMIDDFISITERELDKEALKIFNKQFECNLDIADPKFKYHLDKVIYKIKYVNFNSKKMNRIRQNIDEFMENVDEELKGSYLKEGLVNDIKTINKKIKLIEDTIKMVDKLLSK